jgi:hypothetical protein
MRRAGLSLKTVVVTLSVMSGVAPAFADQGGVSFWLPGTFGSLAAAPLTAGWSWSAAYIHSDVSAGGDVAASRAIRFGNRTANLNVNLNATLDAKVDVVLAGPTYVAADPVFGGQFAIAILGLYGRQQADIHANLTGSLGPIGFAASRSVGQELEAFGDIYLQPTLRWNHGVHNYMAYGMMNLPVGSYDAGRLVNMGLGHWAIDGGAGYTYFDPTKGHEFSVVTGMTYNFENTDLQYQNGIDWHVDWGLSQFLNKQVFVGAVGYWYQQITGDSGAGATFGPFKSRVGGIGPQIGFIFPVGHMQGVLNIKSYWEFEAQNRPEGWNMWVAFNLSPVAEKPSTVQPTHIRK